MMNVVWVLLALAAVALLGAVRTKVRGAKARWLGGARADSRSADYAEQSASKEQMGRWLAEQYVASVRGELSPERRDLVRQSCVRAASSWR